MIGCVLALLEVRDIGWDCVAEAEGFGCGGKVKSIALGRITISRARTTAMRIAIALVQTLAARSEHSNRYSGLIVSHAETNIYAKLKRTVKK